MAGEKDGLVWLERWRKRVLMLTELMRSRIELCALLAVSRMPLLFSRHAVDSTERIIA
jgi:hypothetical protein